MMTIPIYQVDAFTDNLFGGNPAAVCPLNEWLPDEVLQKIGMENNLAETAFYVKNADGYHIRWFTPAVEVDLCGHATLAAAYVLFNFENYPRDEITFNSRSGKLGVIKQQEMLTLDFPVDDVHEVTVTESLKSCFNYSPLRAFKGKTDYMLIFENEEQINTLQPNLPIIATQGERAVIATAKSNTVDFVSRVFGPQAGINEDPVTGSAHTTLVPYWTEQLGKNKLHALQLSARKGELWCELKGDRVLLSGKAVTYLKGEIMIGE